MPDALPAQWTFLSPPRVQKASHIFLLIRLYHLPLRVVKDQPGGVSVALGAGARRRFEAAGQPCLQPQVPIFLEEPQHLSLLVSLVTTAAYNQSGEATSLPGAVTHSTWSLLPNLRGTHSCKNWNPIRQWWALAGTKGACWALGLLIKGAGERGGRGGGGGEQLCVGSEWVTGPLSPLRWPPAGEVGKLWGEYQVSPCRGLFQQKAASLPLNPIKGRYYVSGNVCQS